MSESTRRSRDASPVVAGGLGFLSRLAANSLLDDETRARASQALGDLDAATAEHRLRLAVLGEFSAGKSTFINALLGSELLASDLVPTTAVATRLTWGPAFQIEVHHAHRPTSTLWPTADITRGTMASLAGRLRARADHGLLDRAGGLATSSRLRVTEFIRERTTERAGAADVDEVVIRLPSPYLAAAIDIIDTPGFNPGLSRTNAERHAAVTRRCVESSHIALFLMSSGSQLKSTERSQLDACKPFLSRIIFVVNKMDALDDEEAEDVEGYVRSELAQKFALPPDAAVVYFVSSVDRGPAKYRENLARLREDVVAFMQRERESIVLERTARILATQSAELGGHARAAQEAWQKRLRELQALRIEDEGTMRRRVYARASEVYASVASQRQAEFSASIRTQIDAALREFDARLSGATDREILKSIAEEGTVEVENKQFTIPLREKLVSALASSVGTSLRSMHEEFSSRYANARVAQPKLPPAKTIRALIEADLDSAAANVGVVSAIADEERKGDIAKTVGAVGGAAIGLLLGGPAFVPLAKVGAMAAGALFGPSLDDLRQRARTSFASYIEQRAVQIDTLARLCFVDEQTPMRRQIEEFLNEQLATYGAEVKRLLEAHEHQKRTVEATVCAYEEAGAEADRWAGEAETEAKALRSELARRRSGGRPELSPMIDEAVATIAAREVFGAALQGALEVPGWIERWLAGESARVVGEISPRHRERVAEARAAVEFAEAAATGGETLRRWLVERAEDVRRIGLTALDLAALMPDRELVVKDEGTALHAVVRGAAPADVLRALRQNRKAAKTGTADAAHVVAGGPASELAALDRAYADLQETFVAWGEPVPTTLAAAHERLRAALDREARRARLARTIVTDGAVVAAGVAAVALLGFALRLSMRSDRPVTAPVMAAAVAEAPAVARRPQPPADLQPTASSPGAAAEAPATAPTALQDAASAVDPEATTSNVIDAGPALEAAVPIAAEPADTAGARCVVSAHSAFHLRPTESLASVGPSYAADTRVEVLERGTLTRRRRLAVRVRVESDGAEGWLFLGPEELSACETGVAEPPPAPAAAPPESRILAPSSVAASSFIELRDRSYPPELAFDGDPSTAWNEGRRGHGAGEWIEARFDRPYRIRRLRLTTGWDHVSERDGDLFAQNAHLRRARIVFDDATSVVRDVAEDQRELVLDDLDVTTSRIRIVAAQTWPGTRWADFCIAEVTIEGSEAEQSSRGAHPSRVVSGAHTREPGDDNGARRRDDEAPEDESALQRARTCLRARDEQCAIDALEGRTNTSEELAVLASAYRTAGRTREAMRVMRRYLTRYSRGPLAQMFRDYLEENESGVAQ